MAPPNESPGFSRRTSLHLAVLVLASTLPYLGTLRAPFTLDDDRCIVDNPAIRGLSNAPGAAIASMSASRCGNAARLFGNLTFALNFSLGGLDVLGYHLVNIAIHLATVLLLYRLVSLTFRTPLLAGRAREGDGPLVALFTALLFACHPVQTQAVTYVAQRFASLATLLYLLAVVLYAGARLEAPGLSRRARFAGALASTVLAMLTKEIAFTLPFVLAAYDLSFLGGPARLRIRTLAPFFLALPIIPLAFLQPAGPALDLHAVGLSLQASTNPGTTHWEYLLTEVRVLVTYLRLLVLPVGQNLDYDYRVSRSALEPDVLLSGLLLLALLALGAFLARASRRPGREGLRVPAFGILWFFATSSVEATFFPLADVIFEHRLYLPSAGLFFAGVALAFDLRERLAPRAARLVVPLLSALTVALGVAAYLRNEVWADEVRLWEDAARKSPAKVRPRLWLGWLHLRAGRVDEAAREIEAAVRARPDAATLNALGVVRVRQGRIGEALSAYRTALAKDPSAAEVHDNIGLLYKTVGEVDLAAREYLDAIRLRPDYADAHNDLGALYARQGRLEEAIREFRAALAASPGHAGARNNLETALRATGR